MQKEVYLHTTGTSMSLLKVSSHKKGVLPLLLAGGQAVGLCKVPRAKFDRNSCYINKDEF